LKDFQVQKGKMIMLSVAGMPMVRYHEYAEYSIAVPGSAEVPEVIRKMGFGARETI
jgi:hypothetical protein